MRLLTLNINMFNYQIDNSFYDYLHDINPDLAFNSSILQKKLDKR